MLIIAAIIAILLIDVWLFAVDKYVWSFLVLIASAVGAYFFFTDVKALVDSYGWQTLVMYGVPGYLIAGAVTASLKWVTFTRGIASRLAKTREDFETKWNKRDQSKDEFKDDTVDPRLINKVVIKETNSEADKHAKRSNFFAFLNERDFWVFKRSNRISYRDKDLLDDNVVLDLLTPRTRNYIDRVTFWVLQWPIVLIDFILSDLLLKIGEYIAQVIDTLFNRMARMFVGNAVKGL